MKLYFLSVFSGVYARWLNKYFISIFLALIVIAYFFGYFSCPFTPGNNQQFPLGWWGWFDQGKYLLASNAIANLDFSPANHFYPPFEEQ